MLRPLLAALALFAGGCSCGSSPQPPSNAATEPEPTAKYFGHVDPDPDPSTLSWCNSGEPEVVDPALVTSTTGTPLARLMFAGLAEYGSDIDGRPEPALARRWGVSKDWRTFTFHLREDARWSNGRPITAHDFVYHVARILHPSTQSRKAMTLEPIANAMGFHAGRLRVVTHDSPPFSAGDVVELLGPEGDEIPSSNVRASSRPLALRDLGAPTEDAYASVPAGERVEIIELGGPARDWAYVFRGGAEPRYGWVPASELDVEPNGALQFRARLVGAPKTSGMVRGSHLLLSPEVLGVRAAGDHTLIIKTTEPALHFLGYTASLVFRPAPRESVSRSPGGWTSPESGLLVTSGAFTMTDWRPHDRMVFERSSSFFDRDRVRLERIVSFNRREQEDSLALYARGECDAVTSNNIPAQVLPQLAGDAYDDFTSAPYNGVYYYVINTEKLDNVHLRRALALAVDRSAIPELLGSAGERPTSSFTPGRPVASLSAAEKEKCGLSPGATAGVATFQATGHCYHPPVGLAFDPEAARGELALARQELGADPISFELAFNAGLESHRLIAERIRDQWREHLGIEVSLDPEPWKLYLKRTSAGDYEVGRLGWIGGSADPGAEFLLTFRCSEDSAPDPYNRSRWCNQEFERLYQQAGRTLDPRERLAILRRAEELALEQAPVIPIYVYAQKHLRKPYVRDLGINITDTAPLQWAWIDPDWDR